MGHHLIIDGNTVYEIDEECIKRKTEGIKKTLAESRKRSKREWFGMGGKQGEK